MQPLRFLSRKLASALLALSMCGGGIGTANALVIGLNDAPTAFSFSSTGGPYTLSLSGSIDILSISDRSTSIGFTIQNDSALLDGSTISNPKAVRLTSFGFGIHPNVSGVAFSDAADKGLVGGSLDRIPSLHSIEVCAFGGNNCSGGSNGGIFAGGLDTFVLILSGDFLGLTSLTLDPLGVKFQTQAGSYEFSCAGNGCGGIPPPEKIPEPSTLGLIGLGALGLAYRRRKSSTPKHS